MRTDNSRFSSPAGETLDAAVDAGLCTSTNGQSSTHKSLHFLLGDAERPRRGHAQETGHAEEDANEKAERLRRMCPDYRPMHDPNEPLSDPFEREGRQ